MRVLQFRMLCDSGGVSSVMLLHDRELARRGIDSEFWFCEPSRRLPEFMATGRASLGSLAQLAERLARQDVDVVHMGASDPAAPLVARMAGRARVVVTGHGALADVWHHGDCFGYTAVSEGTAALNRPLTDREITVVQNAIDVERFHPPAHLESGAPILAFVGRTTAAEKDFPRFSRVAKRLNDRGWRVWVADPHAATWDTFAAHAVERVPVERWEPVPFEGMGDFYRAVAASGGVVLVTSRTEGFGMAAPEAAACGARVLAGDGLGLRESVIEGLTGELYPPDLSDDELAQRVVDVAARPHHMETSAAAARASFRPERMTDRYLAVYREGTRRRDGPAPRVAEVPELPVLRAHLARQPAGRATIARRAAPDLARAGFRWLALHAVATVLRDAPRQYLRPDGARQLVRTLGALVRSLGTRRSVP